MKLPIIITGLSMALISMSACASEIEPRQDQQEQASQSEANSQAEQAATNRPSGKKVNPNLPRNRQVNKK